MAETQIEWCRLHMESRRGMFDRHRWLHELLRHGDG